MSKTEGAEGAVMERRRFVAAMFTGLIAQLIPWPVVARTTQRAGSVHPEPRPDVDGSQVLTRSQVSAEAAELFDGIREIPHIADGIGCHCGCGAMPGMRSLLSCYEGVGMAQFCVVCSGEGRMAIRLHGEGRSLDEIREAIDRRFG